MAAASSSSSSNPPPKFYPIPSDCKWRAVLELFQSSYSVPPIDARTIPKAESKKKAKDEDDFVINWKVRQLLKLMTQNGSPIGTDWLRPQRSDLAKKRWVNVSEYWNTSDDGFLSPQRIKNLSKLEEDGYGKRLRGKIVKRIIDANKFRHIDFIEFVDHLCYAYDQFQQKIKAFIINSSLPSSRKKVKWIYIGHKLHKSTGWIMMLLLYITNQFRQLRWTFPDAIVELDGKCRNNIASFITRHSDEDKDLEIHYVFADDCMYSGLQLTENIQTFINMYKKMPFTNNKDFLEQIHVVCPFSTSDDLQESQWDSDKVSTTRANKIGSFYTGRDSLCRIFGIKEILDEMKYMYDDSVFEYYKPLVVFEHKVADAFSLDMEILNLLSCYTAYKGGEKVPITLDHISNNLQSGSYYNGLTVLRNPINDILEDKDENDTDDEDESPAKKQKTSEGTPYFDALKKVNPDIEKLNQNVYEWQIKKDRLDSLMKRSKLLKHHNERDVEILELYREVTKEKMELMRTLKMKSHVQFEEHVRQVFIALALSDSPVSK